MPVLEEVPSAPICVCGSFIEGHSLEYLSSPQAVMNCPCSSSPWDSIKRDRCLYPHFYQWIPLGESLTLEDMHSLREVIHAISRRKIKCFKIKPFDKDFNEQNIIYVKDA